MKYTSGEVLAMAKMVGDEFSPHAGWLLNAFAERIKADEGAVPFGYAYRYADGIKLGGSGRERNGMRPTETIPLFAHPPVQAAQGEASLWRCKACGRATRAVCDGLDGNGLGCTNATSIDIAAVRKVIAHLRQFDSPYTRGLADKLEAALQEKGNG